MCTSMGGGGGISVCYWARRGKGEEVVGGHNAWEGVGCVYIFFSGTIFLCESVCGGCIVRMRG